MSNKEKKVFYSCHSITNAIEQLKRYILSHLRGKREPLNEATEKYLRKLSDDLWEFYRLTREFEEDNKKANEKYIVELSDRIVEDYLQYTRTIDGK